jgi:hypothetical protein
VIVDALTTARADKQSVERVCNREAGEGGKNFARRATGSTVALRGRVGTHGKPRLCFPSQVSWAQVASTAYRPTAQKQPMRITTPRRVGWLTSLKPAASKMLRLLTWSSPR